MTGGFPSQRPVIWKAFPYHDIAMEKEYRTKLTDYLETNAALSILYFGDHVFHVT